MCFHTWLGNKNQAESPSGLTVAGLIRSLNGFQAGNVTEHMKSMFMAILKAA